MRTIQTTYRYRIEPTATQEAELRRFAGARRWIWNWALARKKAHYQATTQTLRTRDLEAELVVLKRQPETAWLADIDSQLLQQVVHDLDQAFGRSSPSGQAFRASNRARSIGRASASHSGWCWKAQTCVSPRSAVCACGCTGL
jgi:transposase